MLPSNAKLSVAKTELSRFFFSLSAVDFFVTGPYWKSKEVLELVTKIIGFGLCTYA